MWLSVLFEATFWFFAALGVVSIIENIVARFTQKDTVEDMFVVLTVKNQQENIEATVRSIVWQNLHSKNGGCVPEIIVVDMGSSDDTYTILEKLAHDYKFIHITDKEGYIEWLKKMDC